MKLAILGGGGFRVPLVYEALLGNSSGIDRVSLYDVSADRLAAIESVLTQMADSHSHAPTVSTTTDLDDALAGADFVFSAIRVGGLHGRTVDERVALQLGVLGQETTGAGGIAYGLRTVPVAVQIAQHVYDVCPDAWVINFTNPAGMITEAMQAILAERVIGICDSPIGLTNRATRALDLTPADTVPDYVGLNHLGWLRGLRRDGIDVLPDLLADFHRLTRVEEARLLGTDWVSTLGAIPNEYLYYYYFTREAVSTIADESATRGEFLLEQQGRFYQDAAADADDALASWRRTRRERDETYMADVRAETGSGQRDQADIDQGGYERVALAVMAALTSDQPQPLILNVRNAGTIDGLPADAVVEVPCTVDRAGPVPTPTAPVEGHQLGLMQQVKAVEQLAITAARTGSRVTALEAFALHPLVDSVSTAQRLLDGYLAQSPELAALFR